MTTEQMINCLSDDRLRWQDDPAGYGIVMKSLKFPWNGALSARAHEVVRRRLLACKASGNPFYGQYPSIRALPARTRDRIGVIQLPTGDWLSMPPRDLCSHVLVSGATGRGKSTWLRGFIGQVLGSWHDVSVICFDRKGTLDVVDSRVLLDSNIKINVFDAKDIPIAPLETPDEKIDDVRWTNAIVGMLSGSWNLFASTNLLLEVTHSLMQSPRPKTWDALVKRLETWKPESRRSLEYRDVLLRNLKATRYALGDAINAAKSNVIELVTRGDRACNVIRIDDLPDVVAALYPCLFLYHDLEYRKANPEARERINVYIMEDSQGLFRRQNANYGEGGAISPLNTLSFMARVFGISLVLSVQNVSETSRFLLQNANTIVCTGAYGDDLIELQRLMNLTPEQAAYLGRLGRVDGQFSEIAAICRTVWPRCLLGTYPYID